MMEERAKNFYSEADNVQMVIDNMDKLLVRLQDEWKGAASISFSQRFHDLKPGFENARLLIIEIGDALKKSADIYRQTDQGIASGFTG